MVEAFRPLLDRFSHDARWHNLTDIL